ncbi:MAG: hypothetical protein RJA70_1852 [Pseudomonadota bacterium]
MRRKLGIGAASLMLFGTSLSTAFAQAPTAEAVTSAAPQAPLVTEPEPTPPEAPAPSVVVQPKESKSTRESPSEARDLPLVLDYEEGLKPPPSYNLVERTRRGLWITGTAVGGALYGLSLTVALGSTHSRDRVLAVPIAGPFLRLVGEENQGTRVMSALDAVGQVASAAMIYAGLTFTKKVWIRGYEKSERDEQSGVAFTLVPFVQSEASGASVIGTF